MKKTILVVALAVMGSTFNADAQTDAPVPAVVVPPKDTTSYFGVKVGGSFNAIAGDQSFKSDYTPGFTVGAFGGIRKKKVGLRIEAQFAYSRNNKIDTFLRGGHINLLYIDIPILVEIKLAKSIWLQLGGQYGTLVTASGNPELVTDVKTFYQSQNVSAVAGIEAIVYKKLSVGGRYIYGLTNIHNKAATTNGQNWTTSAAQVYVAYKIK